MRIYPLCLGVLAVVGCAPDLPDTSGERVVRDSAGVTIVENTVPAWSSAEVWRISEEPILDLGVVAGDPAYEFFRPLGAVRLSDGRLVVADGGALELRYFDTVGTFLRRAGGSGGGPGEFQTLAWFGRVPGDSILAYDRRAWRMSVFDPGGTYVRSFTLEGGDFPLVVGRRADASYLATVPPIRRPGDPPPPPGRGSDSLTLVHYGPDGRIVDTLGTFLRRVTHGHVTEWRGNTIRPSIPVPFTPSTSFAVVGDRSVAGTNRSYELAIYGSGGLERLIRRMHSRLPVTENDTERFVDSLTLLYGDGNPEGEVHLLLVKTTPPQDSMPAFEQMQVDEDANIWVLRTRRPGDPVPVWDVFTPDGTWLGRVEGPAGLRVTDIGRDYVIGLWRDDVDVEHVRMYALRK